MGRPIKDLSGKTFDRLTVVGKPRKLNDNKDVSWKCLCVCGTVKWYFGYNLTNGNVKSCGCINKDRLKEFNVKAFTKHGLHKTPEYDAIRHAIDRCTNPEHEHYRSYGGRGITVSKRYLGPKGIQNFYSDCENFIGLRPGPEYSLDRIDNNKGYYRNNLRWATKLEQRLNQRPRSEWS